MYKPDAMEEAARAIAHAEYAIAFTGAGISAESGIPTFRDPGGIWDKFDPAEIGTTPGIIQVALKQPERIREFLHDTIATFEKANPNPGHHGLVKLEKLGILQSVITQNIDDLHSIAGSAKVFEVHGNLYRFKCLKCNKLKKFSREDILGRLKKALEPKSFVIQMLLDAMPKCVCGSMMRPDVVMFGESVLQLGESYREAQNADVVIVLGTSGMVWPAAGIPYEAKKTRATIIEINPTSNAFRDITDIYVKEHSGEAMPKIVDMVMEMR